jgi:hypothetical protein
MTFNLADAIADDMDFFDGLTSGTVTLKRYGASDVTVSVTAALPQPLDNRMQTFNGVVLTGDEVIINIKQKELNPSSNGRAIMPNDEITVGGITYNVVSARLATVKTRWECACSQRT